MIREAYKVLNFLSIVALCIIFVAVQTVFLKIPALSWLELDLLLLVVVFYSLNKNFVESLLMVIVLGRLAEIHSSSPAGILTTCYLAVLLAIYFTKEIIIVTSSFSTVFVSVFGGVIWKIAFLVLAYRYGLFPAIWKSTLEQTIPYLLSLGIFSKLVFELLKKVNQWSSKEEIDDNNDLIGEEPLL